MEDPRPSERQSVQISGCQVKRLGRDAFLDQPAPARLARDNTQDPLTASTIMAGQTPAKVTTAEYHQLGL